MKLREYLQNIKNTISENIKRREETPKVKFKSAKLAAKVGNWMGVIPYLKTLKPLRLTNEELSKTELRFGALLKEIGVDNLETCIIRELNEDREIVMECLCENTAVNRKIKLRYGNCIDESPEMIITLPNGSVSYAYFSNFEQKLYLNKKALQNKDNTYYRDFYSYFASIRLINQKAFSLKIHVNRPSGTNVDIPGGFILSNESELEEYLLSLPKDAYPLDIFDNFFEICFKDASTEEMNKQNITFEFEPNLLKGLDYDGIRKITLVNGVLRVFTQNKSGFEFLSDIIDNYTTLRKLEMRKKEG